MIENDINLDSFFQKKCTDNNGIGVTDINAGLVNLFGALKNNTNIIENSTYLASEYEEFYPELIAKNSDFGDERYWWWLLILNKLEDPFTQVKANWIYPTFTPLQVHNIIEKSNNEKQEKEIARIGTTIELN